MASGIEVFTPVSHTLFFFWTNGTGSANFIDKEGKNSRLAGKQERKAYTVFTNEHSEPPGPYPAEIINKVLVIEHS
jgi:hypothetical protein